MEYVTFHREIAFCELVVVISILSTKLLQLIIKHLLIQPCCVSLLVVHFLLILQGLTFSGKVQT